MFSSVKMCVLADLKSVQDEETGDRTQVVANAKKIICSQELVGVQTQLLAQSQNMIYSWSIELDRMYYQSQKYLYIDEQVYEIKGITKSIKPHLCKLNVVANNDSQVKTVIEEWLNGNL